MNKKKYIILGLTPQGLSVLRELGKSGADVTAFCTSKRNVGYHSRYGKKICYENLAELKQYIEQIVTTCEYKPLCYITSGEVLASVLTGFPEIYNLCDVIAGPYKTIERLAHKDKMYEIAIAKGFTVAPYTTLDKLDMTKVSYPCFLKRNYEIQTFFKADKIETEEQLLGYMNRLRKDEYKDILLQEFINIPPTDLIYISCQGFYQDGKGKGFLVTNQKRRLKKGITSYIEEFDESPLKVRIQELSAGFMEDLHYNGFAEFEYMYDKTSEKLYFVEVNTRTCGEHSSLHAKFSNMADVLLNPYKNISLNPKVGHLRWMNITRDMRARLQSKNWNHLCDIFHSSFDILDIHDIIPFFRQIR